MVGDGTQRLGDKFDIPQTKENYLALAFGGNPPADGVLDGEVEAELPEAFREWDDDICEAPSSGWCGEPSHTPVDSPPENDESDDDEEN